MYECSTRCILLKTNGKCADQAGWKKAHSGHACNDVIFAYDEKLCAAGRRVPFGDYTEQNDNKRFLSALNLRDDTIQAALILFEL